MRDPLLPGYASHHLAPSTVGDQDARQRLDGGRLTRPVWPDIAHQFSRLQRKRDAVERVYGTVAPGGETADSSPHPRLPFGDPKGFDQVLHDDLRHGWFRRGAQASRW